MNDLTKAALSCVVGVFFFALGIANWADYSRPSPPTRVLRVKEFSHEVTYTESDADYERRYADYTERVIATGANATMPYPLAVAATLAGIVWFVGSAIVLLCMLVEIPAQTKST